MRKCNGRYNKLKILKIYNKSKRYLFRKLYLLFSVLPIKEKKITFASDSREEISGNIEFVYKELLSRDLHLDIKLLLKKTIDKDKSIFYIIKMAWNLSRSKLIILDDFYPMIYQIKIRNGSKLVQLWHAAGAFKTFGFSRLGLEGGPSINSKNHRNYDVVFVSSKNIVKYYAEGFGIQKNKIIPLGVARTDLFFDEELKNNIRKDILEKKPILGKKKVILFAPTFRGNGQSSAYYPNKWLDFDKIYNAFKNENCVFLLKYHPFIKNKYEIPDEYSDIFIDVSSFREINDLLLITDVLITDYSSVIFEYSLLKKKMIFFAPDLSSYIKDRGFYFDYAKLVPGPIINTTVDLIDELKTNTVLDDKKMNEFIKYFFDDTDGESTKRIVDYLLEYK